jgi:hypothetical protein
MKKILLAAAVIMASFTLYAQDANTYVNHNMPAKGTQSFTFGINPSPLNINSGVGRTNTLLYRYYFKDRMAYRAGLNLSFADNTSTNNNQSNKITTKYKYYTPALSFGIQRSFKTYNKLEPYVGVDLIGGYNYTYNSTKNEVSDPNLSNNGDFVQTVTTTNGFNISLAPLVGLNYYLLKNFAIGAEFATGVTFTDINPPRTVTSSKVLGQPQPDQKQDLGPSQKNIEGFRPGQFVKVTASVYF